MLYSFGYPYNFFYYTTFLTKCQALPSKERLLFVGADRKHKANGDIGA